MKNGPKSTAKILFEDHDLTTGIDLQKRKMKIVKWLYSDSKFAVSKKKMTTSEFLNGISFSTEAKVH
jgi:methionyl-tRNA formyltransferase